MKNKKLQVSESLLSTLINDSTKPKPPKLTHIKDLWEMKNDIDLSPYYQREAVWQPEYKINLIHSILNDVPINVIHLVLKKEKNDEDEQEQFIVLDGKQRLTSIFDFMESDFSVPILFGKEMIEVDYKTLKEWRSNSTHKYHDRAKSLIRKFEQYDIMVLYWPELTLLQQSAVFNAINFGIELSVEERVLAKNYNSKIFTKFLMENYLSSLSNSSRAKDNKRGKNLIWTLRMLYIILNGSDDMLDLNPELICKMHYNEGFESFIEKLHLKIELYKDQNKDNLEGSFDSVKEMNKMLLSFGWLDDFKDIQQFVDDIGNKIIEPPAKRKASSDWIMIYYTAFMLNKFQKNILKYGVFSDNFLPFKKIFADYKSWSVEKEPGEKFEKTRRMTYTKVYELHMNKLQELFEQHIIKPGIIDDKPKSKYISAKDRALAWKEANGICIMCKKEFTETDEIQYDHGTASSISSDPVKIYAMHRKCNRQKSDHTPQTAKQLNNFFDEQVIQ